MLHLRNANFEVRIASFAKIELRNCQTDALWELDAETLLSEGTGETRPAYGPEVRQCHCDGADERDRLPARACRSWRTVLLNEQAADVICEGPSGQAHFRYELTCEGLRITLLAGQSTVTSCALPGAFRPKGVDSPAVVFPLNQGIWHRGTGRPFSFNYHHDGHGGFSMPFFAVVGSRDALVTILEDEHDARIWFERTENGRMRVACLQDPTFGKLRYDRSVLLRFSAPTSAAIAKSYRQYIKDHGEFCSWEEKIAERPAVEQLFGALMCFIGYCHDDAVDYAAGFKALKAMGFERAFVSPISINNTLKNFRMGGLPSIRIEEHLPLLRDLGYQASSTMWLADGPPSLKDNRRTECGKEHLSWSIDEQKWHHVCSVRQLATANRIFDDQMQGRTAQFFDVTCSLPPCECHHPDHPVDRRGDAAWRRQLLDAARRRGMIVSSEGFWGFASPSYDIGSVKIPIPVHADWYTVPLTSLVYHDSMIHDWWEVDNYNNPRHRVKNDSSYFPLRHGGNHLFQAAQDALAGWPPNVFPFGTQYAWVDRPLHETYAYTCSMADPEVKQALQAALPVAKLHGRIGKLECVDHRVHTPDGSVQSTLFSDGTSVLANFGHEPVEAAAPGFIPPVSWKVLDR